MNASLLRIAAAALAIGVGCSGAHFDFADDSEDAGSDAGCPDVPLEFASCHYDGAGCSGTAEAISAEIATSRGCTPAGLSLGALRIDADLPDGGVFDLLAWVEPDDEQAGPFLSGASLAAFGDRCGERPGAGQLECGYRPWLAKRSVDLSDPLYLHVQTPAPREEGLEVGFQVRNAQGWSPQLPAADEPISCNPGAGHVSDLLVLDPPWYAGGTTLDLSAAPPAFEEEPRICRGSAGGWRQAAYLLRNQGDDPLRIESIRLSGGPQSALENFHFALFACDAGGEVLPDAAQLAASCELAGDAASKRVQAEIPPWVPDLAQTERVLLVQVPPTTRLDPLLLVEIESR
ncbi:MAG: hypothetical protein R6V85_07070 [Polyangia bacterium]